MLLIIASIIANRADPDEMLYTVASHLALHWLTMSHYGPIGLSLRLCMLSNFSGFFAFCRLFLFFFESQVSKKFLQVLPSDSNSWDPDQTQHF